MADTFTNLLVHIIFSTKHREPFIQEPLRGRLYEYIGGVTGDILPPRPGLVIAIDLPTRGRRASGALTAGYMPAPLRGALSVTGRRACGASTVLQG